jgi:hypothetical protein
MGRASREVGSVASEIIKVEPELISIRLENGEYVGPRLIKYEDGKLRLAPGEQPLEYTPENLARIESEGWNIRNHYDKDAIERLMNGIEALGGFDPQKPLELILSGDRLFPHDGHRRHFAWWLLQKKGILFRPMYATVVAMRGVSIRDLEIRMLVRDELHEHHTAAERAAKIKRMMERSLKEGMDRDEFKEKFLKDTGWSERQFDATIALTTLPADLMKALSEKHIPEGKTLELLRSPKLTIDEVVAGLREAISGAESAGKEKVTGAFITEVIKDRLEAKVIPINSNILPFYKGDQQAGSFPDAPSVDNAQTGESSEKENSANNANSGSRESGGSGKPAPQPRPLQPKQPRPTASEMAQLFKLLVESAKATGRGKDTDLIIPSDLWERCLQTVNRGARK